MNSALHFTSDATSRPDVPWASLRRHLTWNVTYIRIKTHGNDRISHFELFNKSCLKTAIMKKAISGVWPLNSEMHAEDDSETAHNTSNMVCK